MHNTLYYAEELLAAFRNADKAPVGEHLTDDQFILYSLGMLPDNEEEAIDSHLLTCPVCTRQMEDLPSTSSAWEGDSGNNRLNAFRQELLAEFPGKVDSADPNASNHANDAPLDPSKPHRRDSDKEGVVTIRLGDIINRATRDFFQAASLARRPVLGGEEEEAIDSHLLTCPVCTRQMEDLPSTSSAWEGDSGNNRLNAFRQELLAEFPGKVDSADPNASNHANDAPLDPSEPHRRDSDEEGLGTVRIRLDWQVFRKGWLAVNSDLVPLEQGTVRALTTVGPQIAAESLRLATVTSGLPQFILVPNRRDVRLAMRTLTGVLTVQSPPRTVELLYAQQQDGHRTLSQGTQQRLRSADVLIIDTDSGHGAVLDELCLLAADAGARSVSAAVLLSRMALSCEDALRHHLDGRFFRLFHLPLRTIAIQTTDPSRCPVCHERDRVQ